MSQDGNNLYNLAFDPNGAVYQADVQFAPSVPHRHSITQQQQQQQHLAMNFSQSPFQPHELNMSPQQCKL